MIPRVILQMPETDSRKRCFYVARYPILHDYTPVKRRVLRKEFFQRSNDLPSLIQDAEPRGFLTLTFCNVKSPHGIPGSTEAPEWCVYIHIHMHVFTPFEKPSFSVTFKTAFISHTYTTKSFPYILQRKLKYSYNI